MKKKTFYVMVCCWVMTLLVSCSGPKEQVHLVIWGGESSQELLQQMADSFIEQYKEEADITISSGVEGEDTLRETVIANLAAAADVFSFPDDQMADLVKAGALLPITQETDQVIEQNGGNDSVAVQSAMADGVLYAYPMTASNGYFMYYDSSFFTEEDVQSLDRMMQIAQENGKYVSMDFSSGWYTYSFFAGAGLTLGLNEAGSNYCNFNGESDEYSGVEVAEAMLDIATNPGFIDAENEKFQSMIQDGTIIAGINGTWSAGIVEAALGENYAACKLPTYSIGGNQEQMMSFAGYKLVGVNANTQNPEWAMKLANWVTNYDNQLLRFQTIGEGPSNLLVAQSIEVQNAPAMIALSEQSRYAVLQHVGSQYWEPMVLFGTIIASGNPDGKNLQELLDETVGEITQPTE
ncbi:MAG TPA: extracellular solute-binding protein [Lachnospiraceae bacterium]|nr:extracellular solute-binding protein [Lachnospiraceae bacterium]